MSKSPNQSNLPELVREFENNYISGPTTISAHVEFDMLETLNKIEAYINSKHVSGDTDSQGREKPFFNIVTAACNIWYRATDIDRKNIKIKPTKAKDTIDAFLATVHLQDWMRRENFGTFLNEWGRVLSRYGSAVVKFIENSEGLNPMVVPWNRLIVDQVDFENNMVVEVLELTEAQLKKRKGYDKEVVKNLCDALKARETIDKRRKDNKNDYIKLYEVHGELPLSLLTGKEENEDEYVQQMHVISFVAKKGKREYDDFTLISGRETKSPYKITHLIREDGRALAIGAVEHLFEAQWMMNHTVKSIKDQLDLASKLIFQTSDGNFVGQNALSAIENGDILIHAINQPLTQLANSSHDITSLQAFGGQWKTLANEITGVSEAMLGAQPKAGQAWRQTEALLQESYSLFELMAENKALHIEEMMREYVIPYIKKKMDTAKEVSATLEAHDLDRIDSKYIKSVSTKRVNQAIKDKALKGQAVSPMEQQLMTMGMESQVKESLTSLGNQRFFKPSELSDKTWKKQFENLEWELEVDITGESHDVQSALATLNTALQVIMNPAFEQNKKAQHVVDKILTLTGTLSPLELSAIPSPIQPQTIPATPDGGVGAGVEELASKQ